MTLTKNNVEDRVFLLNSNVTAESVENIILGIQAINRKDKKDGKNKVKFKRKPIKVIIDSFGGDCYSGMALVNVINTSKTPVHTYCYGKAMSMGLTIYSVGHKRFAHKYASFMQHQMLGGTQGKLIDMTQGIEEWTKLQEMMDNVLVEKTNIKKSKLLKLREKKKDWYFSGEEALKLGLVDKLISK